jgi:hypothetical protein
VPNTVGISLTSFTVHTEETAKPSLDSTIQATLVRTGRSLAKNGIAGTRCSNARNSLTEGNPEMADKAPMEFRTALAKWDDDDDDTNIRLAIILGDDHRISVDFWKGGQAPPFVQLWTGDESLVAEEQTPQSVREWFEEAAADKDLLDSLISRWRS